MASTLMSKHPQPQLPAKDREVLQLIALEQMLSELAKVAPQLTVGDRTHQGQWLTMALAINGEITGEVATTGVLHRFTWRGKSVQHHQGWLLLTAINHYFTKDIILYA